MQVPLWPPDLVHCFGDPLLSGVPAAKADDRGCSNASLQETFADTDS